MVKPLLFGFALFACLALCGCGGGNEQAAEQALQPLSKKIKHAGPINPPPPGLWAPLPGSMPTSGRYVFLQSDFGDSIGQGAINLYTPANALLSVTVNGGYFGISVRGAQEWNGDFVAMLPLTQLQVGYYSDLQRYSFHDPGKGGVSWYGEHRGCNTLTGWFVVDEVSYSNGMLMSIKLRFEQHCEGAVSALHGEVNWTATDPATPPGPVVPPPQNLWAPPPGATPAAGNYVYVQSEVGDIVGGGQTYLHTPADSVITVSTDTGYFGIRVNGTYWHGDFKGMSHLTQLQAGYYGDLRLYPFHDLSKGGLSWSNANACNTVAGWFVVDKISYLNGALSSIKLRFEQHCEMFTPALRGEISWTR
jgi:hypothetical protein